MQQRVLIVHGYNVRDNGRATTGRLAGLMRIYGYEVHECSGGWRGLLGVRFGNRRRAQLLSAMVRPGDWLIGHSDGTNLINQAMHHLASLSDLRVNCVYFNPALDKDTPLAPGVARCLVYHTRSDYVVGIARLLRCHPWGEMGRTGYRPADPGPGDRRYKNIAYEQLGYAELGHCGVFKNNAALKSALNQIEQHLV